MRGGRLRFFVGRYRRAEKIGQLKGLGVGVYGSTSCFETFDHFCGRPLEHSGEFWGQSLSARRGEHSINSGCRLLGGGKECGTVIPGFKPRELTRADGGELWVCFGLCFRGNDGFIETSAKDSFQTAQTGKNDFERFKKRTFQGVDAAQGVVREIPAENFDFFCQCLNLCGHA